MTVEFRVDKDESIVYGTLKGEVNYAEVLAGGQFTAMRDNLGM